MKFKQIIIARKDLHMSVGKLSAQVSHASMAFLSNWIKESVCHDEYGNLIENNGYVFIDNKFPKDVFDGWILDAFTKTVVEAKNKNRFLKAVEWAANHGLEEGRDYFFIRDNCLTELQPEEVDKNGVGRTLTCIGFRPLPEDLANELSHMYHLYV